MGGCPKLKLRGLHSHLMPDTHHSVNKDPLQQARYGAERQERECVSPALTHNHEGDTYQIGEY